MSTPKDKDIHVDLLEIDMTEGRYWLDPLLKNSEQRNAKRKAKDKEWLAEQKRKREKSE